MNRQEAVEAFAKLVHLRRKSQALIVESAPADLSAAEKTAAEHKLLEAIEAKLNGNYAITISYDPQRGRVGRERLMAVDSGSTHIVMKKHTHGGKPDTVLITWVDESTLQAGQCKFFDNPDEPENPKFYGWTPTTNSKGLAFFMEKGGLGLTFHNQILPMISGNEIVAITEKVESGRLNPMLTTAGQVELRRAWGARRIDALIHPN